MVEYEVLAEFHISIPVLKSVPRPSMGSRYRGRDARRVERVDPNLDRGQSSTPNPFENGIDGMTGQTSALTPIANPVTEIPMTHREMWCVVQCDEADQTCGLIHSPMV